MNLADRLGTLGAVGVVAAYVTYGRIIQDPMLLVRLVLRLLGLIPETA